MKWYSVKKYKPSIKECMYMVRTTCGEIYIATLQGTDELVWISDDEKYFDHDSITHFCMPDPLEIEE